MDQFQIVVGREENKQQEMPTKRRGGVVKKRP
jgi:hypothetical protein